MRKAVLVICGLLVVMVPSLAQENPFQKAVIDWYVYVQEWRSTFGVELIDTAVNPIGLEDMLFLRKVVGLNSRALASLYEEIQANGPISTLERLSRVKYCGSITVLTKVLMFYTFPDEQRVVETNELLVESYPTTDWIWTLIRWAEQGIESQ